MRMHTLRMTLEALLKGEPLLPPGAFMDMTVEVDEVLPEAAGTRTTLGVTNASVHEAASATRATEIAPEWTMVLRS